MAAICIVISFERLDGSLALGWSLPHYQIKKAKVGLIPPYMIVALEG